MKRFLVVLIAIFPAMAFAQVKKPVVEKIFKTDQGTLHEYLKIKKISKTKIAYEIFMSGDSCKALKHKGIAVLKYGGETDIDGDYIAFAVAEYIDRSKACWVTLRLGAEKGYMNRARFIIADCEKLKPCKTESEALYSGK